MQLAPFLLQAFAARVLASKPQEKISRAELAKQGYDVEILVEMIVAYSKVPEAEREFIVKATATDILIRRKPNCPAPATPQASVPTTPAAPTSTAKPALPGAQIKLEDVMKTHSAGNQPKK